MHAFFDEEQLKLTLRSDSPQEQDFLHTLFVQVMQSGKVLGGPRFPIEAEHTDGEVPVGFVFTRKTRAELFRERARVKPEEKGGSS